MAKYIIQGETLKAIADEVRDLVDITDEINPNEMIANMEQANADVAAQTEIIEQIRTALDGKAGSNAAEIGIIIDNSGVLDSTEGTVEEKVEQLIDLAVYKKIIQDGLNANPDQMQRIFNNISYPQVADFDFSQIAVMGYMFRGNTGIENIDIDVSNAWHFQDWIVNCKNLKTVILRNFGKNTTKDISLTSAFAACVKLEHIETLDFSKVKTSAAVNNIFGSGSNSIKVIKIVPETISVSIAIPSPALTDEGVQYIFDGLATVTSAQTLTLNANLKILQSQVDSANAKGWTVAGGTVVSEEEYYG